MKSTTFALTAIALAAAAFAAQAAAPSADSVHIDPKRLSQDVRILSSDEYEGRAPNSAGETKTVDYLVKQFQAAGLQPGGTLVDGKRGAVRGAALGGVTGAAGCVAMIELFLGGKLPQKGFVRQEDAALADFLATRAGARLTGEACSLPAFKRPSSPRAAGI